MELAAFDQVSAFDHLRDEWNALLKRSTANSVFSTWEWQSIWWEAYHPGKLWLITCRDGDHLVGIAPCFIHESDGQHVVSLVGCEDVTDYLDFIIDRDAVDEVLACFAAFFAEQSDRFDVINLCNFPQETVTRSRFPAMLQSHGFAVDEVQLDVCPVFEVPDTWDDYLAMLPKKQRHELRRKLRRSHGATEVIDFYTVSDEHDLNQHVDTFMQLMASSDIEKETFLQDPQHVAFFRSIVPVLYENGWLQFDFLTVDGAPAAAYLNLVYEKRLMVYNSGLLRGGDVDHLSAGILLLANMIRQAIERNVEVFDFLRGNESYKYHMGGQDTGVFALRASMRDQ